MNRCIILNGDYTYLNIVSWRRAVCLMIKGKTEVLKYADKVLHCADGSIIKMPLIMRLIKIVNVMVRDKYKCVYCDGNNKLTIDHIIPVSRGGKSTFENCATACKSCNNKKGSRTPSEAKMYMSKQAYSPTISEFLRLKMKQLGVDKYLKEMGVF